MENQAAEDRDDEGEEFSDTGDEGEEFSDTGDEVESAGGEYEPCIVNDRNNLWRRCFQ